MAKLFRNMTLGILITVMCFSLSAFAAETNEGTFDDGLMTTEISQDVQSVSENMEDSQNSENVEGNVEENIEDNTEENVEGPDDSNDQNSEEVQEPEWKVGWNEYEGNWYYCRNSGELYLGWIKLKSKWYYLDGSNEANPGIMACDEIKIIDNEYYAFDSNGVMQTGWVSRPEGWYYANASGALCSGWVKVKGKWYYLDAANESYPLLMKSNEIVIINEKRYSFNSSGAMQTGWISKPEGWYYANTSGALCSGWVKVKGKWYYLDAGNESYPLLMKSNEIVMINEKRYSFDGNGAMQTGWISKPEGWYYANTSGALCTGWVKVKGKWYYLNPVNETNPLLMKSNEIVMINGKYYAFSSSGAMQTGWVSKPEGWYYANYNGDFASGWKKVGKKWYYLDPANQEYPCLMVANETREIDGQTYTFENSGAMKAGWKFVDGNWYYYGTDSGQIVVNWQFIDGYWYYFYKDEDSYGVMAKNTVIDGVYVVHDNGAYIRSRNKLGWQNPSNYPQVSSMTVALPSYCNGYFTYVTPSRISIYASKQECIDAFIARAYEYLGTQYIEPWSSWPGDAVDCSGLVLQCLYATGMDLGVYNPYNHRWLPSQTYNSMNWYNNNTFMPVSINALQRGDLVYYRGHVAIYLGNGQIIDSWPGQGVSIRSIGSRGAVIGAARPFV